jgi:hypothetical protein
LEGFAPKRALALEGFNQFNLACPAKAPERRACTPQLQSTAIKLKGHSTKLPGRSGQGRRLECSLGLDGQEDAWAVQAAGWGPARGAWPLCILRAAF